MAGRTGVAALALALVLHGSTKRPAVRHSAAPAAGTVPMTKSLKKGQNIDLNVSDGTKNGVSRPNGWPDRSDYPGRWLHSDVKDVPYFYTYKLFEKIIEKGNLR